MKSHFFKEILSIPTEKPLSATRRFTVISAFIAYCVTGLSMMLAPDIWNIVFGFNFTGENRGYFTLVGENLMIIGFCWLVIARDNSNPVLGDGPVLGSVLSRLVLVNFKLWSFYSQGLIPLPFALLFSGLDSGLALITYAIWYHETEGASLKRFFSEIWTVANPFSCAQRKPVYVILQAIGYLQLVSCDSTFTSPFLKLTGIIPPESVGTHAEGLLLSTFEMLSIHGWCHVMAGGAESRSFMIAAMCYRVVSIPYFLFLGFTSKIGMALTVVLVLLYMVYSLIIFILLSFEKSAQEKKN